MLADPRGCFGAARPDTSACLHLRAADTGMRCNPEARVPAGYGRHATPPERVQVTGIGTWTHTLTRRAMRGDLSRSAGEVALD